MRIALLSDIHGNLFALEAMLAMLTRETIDQIVCLGDVAMFGPQPCAVLARMQTVACPVVMGNTDAWALAHSRLRGVMNKVKCLISQPAVGGICDHRLVAG